MYESRSKLANDLTSFLKKHTYMEKESYLSNRNSTSYLYEIQTVFAILHLQLQICKMNFVL